MPHVSNVRLTVCVTNAKKPTTWPADGFKPGTFCTIVTHCTAPLLALMQDGTSVVIWYPATCETDDVFVLQEECQSFQIKGSAKARVMFIEGGDPLTSDVESLSVRPAPQLDEEGTVSSYVCCLSILIYLTISYTLFSKRHIDVTS